jgi:hypothetical protein
MGTNGEMIDLGEAIERAVDAARQGDVGRLEVELAALRRLQMEGTTALSAKLRGMVGAVRTHPSFRSAPAAAAG